MNTTSCFRFLLLAALLPLVSLHAANQPAAGTPTSATDAALAAAITATTNAAMAKVTSIAAPTPLAPPAAVTTAVPVQPAAPQAVATQPAEPAKDAPPAWATTRDAFLSFALDKAKSYTGKAEEVAAKAVDTAVKEGPATAAEFLRWKAWFHGLHMLLPALIALAVVLSYLWVWRKLGEAEQTDAFFGRCLCTAGALLIVGCAIDAFATHLYPFVQIIVAPRIYMIEQVLHLFGK